MALAAASRPMPDDAIEDPATRMYRHRDDVLCDDVGDGSPVVFAHGTLMDRTMFRPQLDALRDDHRCVAYDLRARTDRWEGPYDLDDLCRDLDAFADARGLDSFVLAGMSMGGFMGLRYALSRDRLDGLVLIDSMAEAHEQAERDQYGTMLDQIEGQDEPPEPLLDVVSEILFGQTTVEEREDLVDHWTERWATYPAGAVIAEVESWLDRPSVQDRLDAIDVPTLAVHGEEDAALAPERGERTADAIPDGRFVAIPEAGHSSNTENPEAVNAALREFLDEVY